MLDNTDNSGRQRVNVADDVIYMFICKQQRIVGCIDDQWQESSILWLVSQPIIASHSTAVFGGSWWLLFDLDHVGWFCTV